MLPVPVAGTVCTLGGDAAALLLIGVGGAVLVVIGGGRVSTGGVGVHAGGGTALPAVLGGCLLVLGGCLVVHGGLATVPAVVRAAVFTARAVKSPAPC